MAKDRRLFSRWNPFDRRAPADENDFGGNVVVTNVRSSPGRSSAFSRFDRSIMEGFKVKVANDVAAYKFEHIRVDENGLPDTTEDSDLNFCLTWQSNIDQTPNSLFREATLELLSEGESALVPIDTTNDVYLTDSYDIQTLRVGHIVHHRPRHVVVEVYNDRNGRIQKLVMPKTDVAIVPNPLYEVMNKPNSYYRRYVRAMNLMDTLDADNASGKMNIAIQLPYSTRTDQMEKQAKKRMDYIEKELKDNPYGLVFLDGQEKIIQLNRPIESNLLERVEYYQKQALNQLGITEEVINGSADAKIMANYRRSIVKPIVREFEKTMTTAYVSKNSITRGVQIKAYLNALEDVDNETLPTLAKELKAAEVVSSNEIRGAIGLKPDRKNARSNELVNPAINPTADDPTAQQTQGANVDPLPSEGEIQNGETT